jgi:hypothetical protein
MLPPFSGAHAASIQGRSAGSPDRRIDGSPCFSNGAGTPVARARDGELAMSGAKPWFPAIGFAFFQFGLNMCYVPIFRCSLRHELLLLFILTYLGIISRVYS